MPRPVPRMTAAESTWAVFNSSYAVIRARPEWKEALISPKWDKRAIRRHASDGSGASLRIEQRNALVVRRLGQRLEVGVDVGEIRFREDRALVRRHRAAGVAHERRERLERHRVRRELRAGDAALPHEAVA